MGGAGTAGRLYRQPARNVPPAEAGCPATIARSGSQVGGGGARYRTRVRRAPKKKTRIAPTSASPPMVTRICEVSMSSCAHALRSLRLFVTTDTLENDMAAAATMGLNSQPVHGYSTPAATGMPSTL